MKNTIIARLLAQFEKDNGGEYVPNKNVLVTMFDTCAVRWGTVTSIVVDDDFDYLHVQLDDSMTLYINPSTLTETDYRTYHRFYGTVDVGDDHNE